MLVRVVAATFVGIAFVTGGVATAFVSADVPTFTPLPAAVAATVFVAAGVVPVAATPAEAFVNPEAVFVRPALAFVTPVVPAFAKPAAAFVRVAAAAATVAPPPAPSPAPLTTAGTGAELIDEFTVICGLAATDGDWN